MAKLNTTNIYGDLTVNGKTKLSLDTTINNKTVFHEGNLNPALYAKLADPKFTGTPESVTPATDDNTTKIATTKFVKDQGYAAGVHYHIGTYRPVGNIPAAEITGLATVATTGAYSNLSGLPTMPTTYTFNLNTAWSGSGPYTKSIPITGLTTDDLVILRGDSKTSSNLIFNTHNLSWSINAGYLNLSVISKPSTTLNLKIYIIKCITGTL